MEYVIKYKYLMYILIHIVHNRCNIYIIDVICMYIYICPVHYYSRFQDNPCPPAQTRPPGHVAKGFRRLDKRARHENRTVRLKE